VTYRITRSALIEAVIATLPRHALAPLAEATIVLSLSPWSGAPFIGHNPDAPLRELPFGDGRGIVTYLVLERDRQVDIVQIAWLDL
jgi:hypothetical protein